MPEEFHVAIQKRGILTLPAPIRKRHHLDSPGAQVRIVDRDDGVIELHATLPVPADQVWFWSNQWQRREREADDQITDGQVTTFEDVEAFLDDLEH